MKYTSPPDSYAASFSTNASTKAIISSIVFITVGFKVAFLTFKAAVSS